MGKGLDIVQDFWVKLIKPSEKRRIEIQICQKFA